MMLVPEFAILEELRRETEEARAAHATARRRGELRDDGLGVADEFFASVDVDWELS